MPPNVTLGQTTTQKAGQGNQTDPYKAILDRFESVLQVRFKGDPTKQSAELEKFKKALIDGSIEAKKAEAILDKKNKLEERKANLDAAKKEAQIRLAAAKSEEEANQIQREITSLSFKKAGQSLMEAGAKAASKILNGALNFGAFFDKGIEQYASIFSKYSASVEARLQSGSSDDNKRFDALVKQVKSNLAASPYLKQEKMLDNLNELIQKGVNYNIEQRAFLQSVTDKVVTTFNAFDSNLLNLIRLQQADSTAARMGMEASLTKSFNAMFKDTSYLSDGYDSVSQALFGTISQLGRDEGLAFEYVVQKWLGSLGSVGVGTDTLTKIATAVNYLGTGNIQALQNDSAMMNLLTIAANRQGLNIGSILTEGLNSTSTNTLLRGVVDYVREIAAQDNQVVRQQFGQLFGVSMSDMVAALNINTEQLNTVQQAMIDYTSSVRETQSQLNQVSSRMHISEMIDTLFDNVMATTSADIAGNTGKYMLWKSLNIIEQLTGGIAIPTIGIMGNSVDLETTVTGLIKSGIAGLSMIGTLVSAVGSISNKGGMNLSAWGGEEYLQRGAGFGGVTSGYAVTTSRSTAMVSSSGTDMADHSIAAASEEGNQKIEGAKSEETATERMLKAIMRAVTGSDDPESGATRVSVSLSNTDQIPVIVKNTDFERIPVNGLL